MTMGENPRGEPPAGTLSPDGAWRWQDGQWVSTTDDGDSLRVRQEQEAGRKRKHGWLPRRKILVLAGGAALVVLAIALTAVRGGESAGSQAIEARGSLVIVGGGGYTTYDPCHGISGGGYIVDPFDYTDLRDGTPVKVLDASGTIIGTGSLGPGDYVKDNGVNGGDGCRFRFTVPLDSKSSHYQLVIGDRPTFDFEDPSDLDLVVGPH
ncbi:hypothetical protein K1X13_05370 [Nocardioides sp. WL0053]|uniref:DUF2510 domain-containing protein n=1 Tax=Nocardioides jiangsuensis TaxID=2866161 RepID=A0ABS7RGT0_9ACTN|nr:hypothetical protein [Nocardioides jiangsuensis]MBY9074248.1 hypothetical protein [Nocardioides jiangsuensis]